MTSQKDRKSPAIPPQSPVDRCRALDAHRNPCPTPPEDGSHWCSRHNEERVKLYQNYKFHHNTLDTFPEDKICRDVQAIRECNSLEGVRAWSKALSDKHKLYTRCIDARAYFTERFFGSDMDFGHKTFCELLKTQRAEIESLMTEVDQRAYELFLRKQNAFWVLQKQQEEADAVYDPCGDVSHSDHEKPPPPTKSKRPKAKKAIQTVAPVPVAQLQEVEDPLDVALRLKRNDIWEKIRTRLAAFAAMQQSRFYGERLNVIYACVRRAIYTDASLMLLAANYKSVKVLLKDPTFELPVIEKLWQAIRHLSIDLVRAAVDDVIRPESSKDQEHVVVLGGEVFKELSGTRWPLHAWGHMIAIQQCYTCIRRVCVTLEDMNDLTKYCLITGPWLVQSQLKYSWPGLDGTRFLGLCGFIPNQIEDMGPRFSISKCNCTFKRGVAHWQEVKTNPVICAGLSLKDPKAQEFVDACMRHPDLMVLARRGPDGAIVRSHDIIKGAYRRQAYTRAGLQRAEWEETPEQVWRDTILDEALPYLSWDRRIKECLQVAIVDDGDGELVDFVDKLVKVWAQVYGVEDELDIVGIIRDPYLEAGELELRKDRKQGNGASPMLSHVERDIAKSYKRLWGVNPPPTFQEDWGETELMVGRKS